MADAGTLDLGLAAVPGPSEDQDNITDWALERFQERYGADITKDDVWEYLYGVMHAVDWRERYKHDLQRNLPRVPFAADFEAFRVAGRELMDLHIGYEICPEYPGVVCELDETAINACPRQDDARQDYAACRITNTMRWGRSASGKRDDKSVLEINDRCRLVGIPSQAHAYTVSGRSPLEWAVASLRIKQDRASGISDDPNGWTAWDDDPYELIRHLKRLVYLSVRSAEVIAGLPAALTVEDTATEGA